MIHANIKATFLYELETEGFVCTDTALETAEENLVYALEEFDGFGSTNKIKVTEVYVKSDRKVAIVTFTAEDIIFVEQSEIDWALKQDICDTIKITEDNTPDPDDWDGIGESTMNKFDTGCK